MRVLYVSDFGGLGGAEQSLLQLLGDVRDRGVEPLLACPMPGELGAAAAARGVPVFPIVPCRLERRLSWAARTRLPWLCASVTHRLVRIVHERRVDLVHTNSHRAQIWAWPALRFARRPFVWHWRDFYQFPRLSRVLANGRGVCVATSESMYEFAKAQIGTACPVVTIPNGVAPEACPPDGGATRSWRDAHGIAPSACLVVAMAQAVPRKGLETLIRAFPRARQRCGDLTCVIVSWWFTERSREWFERLRALITEQGCGGDLMLMGQGPDPSVILGAADIVVVPSRREPFGRIAVEAMLSEKPVVATAVDGLKEIVLDGATGFLVPVDDTNRLTEALVALATDAPLRVRLGECGRRRALTEFSPVRTADAVLRVYRGLLPTPFSFPP